MGGGTITAVVSVVSGNNGLGKTTRGVGWGSACGSHAAAGVTDAQAIPAHQLEWLNRLTAGFHVAVGLRSSAEDAIVPAGGGNKGRAGRRLQRVWRATKRGNPLH